MAKKTYKKLIPLTEIQQLKKDFPNYDKTKLEAYYDMNGNIIKLVTSNTELQALMKVKGFIET